MIVALGSSLLVPGRALAVTSVTFIALYGPSSIPLGGTTLAVFDFGANPGESVSGVWFDTTLPPGLSVDVVLASECGGLLSATAGGDSISLSGGSFTGICKITVDVTASSAGAKSNTVSAGWDGGSNPLHSMGLMVFAPPTIAAAFSAPSMSVGQAVSLNFTISNPPGNSTVDGVGFTDTLPAGLTVSDGWTTVCGGGRLQRTAPNLITLSIAVIQDGSQCVVSVMVTGSSAGSYSTTTGTVSSTEGGTGNTATASINVDDHPSIAASFNPSSITAGGTAQLTITITNPAGNPDTLSFIDLSDTLPDGLTVATAPMVAMCGAGSLTVTAPHSIVLHTASVAPGTHCQFSVSVTASAAGSYANNVTATLGGSPFPGGTTSAGLAVGAASPPPTSTLDDAGTGAPAPLPGFLVIALVAGLAAAGLTLRRRNWIRR
jgi:uncharacterized repeat protein (TIGR01451 family)